MPTFMPSGKRSTRTTLCRILLIANGSLCALAADLSLNPATFSSLGQVDTRFQSYNVEMLEVTGGRFWKPYKELDAAKSVAAGAAKPAATPGGMNPNLYAYRPPLNLANPRLQKLAAALGPAYMRVSGTWANTTYFQDSDGPAPTTPPAGFNGVLTRSQWKAVVGFAGATGAQIITSFAVSAGTRNQQGVWTPDQAHTLLNYTASLGGRIAATEFMNEPNLLRLGGVPQGYTAAGYARDLALFRAFLKGASSDTLLLGPGTAVENSKTALPANLGTVTSEALMKASGPIYDVFSYHLYPAVSQRCAGSGRSTGTTAAAALSEEWLNRSAEINDFYTRLRNRYEPGKPIWVTETADAACGGDPWAATFLDTFRYLDEHARLAQAGVRVIAHNTLAASDYGLLDENTYAPRPNYWAALLWHQLMGRTVLQTGAAPALHTYAHCLPSVPGGVALLVINNQRSEARTLTLATASERYTLTAPALEGTQVELNGKPLQLGSGDSLPTLSGLPAPAGSLTLPPASVTFLAIPNAANPSCR